VIPFLDARLRLIIPDQRGHGDSDRPSGGYSPADLANDAIELLNALGIASAAAVGHCMGGFVLQRMITMAPSRVNRAVLVASAASANNGVVRSLLPAVQALTDPVDPAFVREFQLSTIHRPVPADFLDRVVAESLKLPARVWQAVLAELLNLPVLAGARSIPCPISLFWGDHDLIFSQADQHELLGRLPGSSLEIFKGVGHAIHWEAPQEFSVRLMRAL
jgi:pimeloyl-ACP methyl ester carboxylesterase